MEEAMLARKIIPVSLSRYPGLLPKSLLTFMQLLNA
ncbi:hypothetical protein PI125_g22419, partial [Phytophthora idaei]